MEWSHKPTSEYFKSLHPRVRQRITCEKAIARALAKDAIARGYVVSVFNGENFEIQFSRNVSKIVAALGTTDEEWMKIAEPIEGGKFRKIGAFYLVYGNSGYDVVSDYSWIENETRNTEEAMKAIDKAAQPVADRWEKRIDGF
jgi:hypothetical protein